MSLKNLFRKTVESVDEYDKALNESKEIALQRIEEACERYNVMIDKYLSKYPEHGAEDVLEMLRRVHQRGRNKTTGETNK